MISILTPSRSRPELATRMYNSVVDTQAGDVKVSLGLDNDDPMLSSYHNLGIHHGIYTNLSVGQIWNVLHDSSSADIFLLGNDDIVFQTEGWDKAVEAAMPKDKPHLVWCDDGINGEKHAAFPFVNKAWIDAVGYYLPECFNFLYHDTWLFDVAKRAGCFTYLPDVMIEHWHFSVGKAEFDETYQRHRRGAQDRRNEDGLIFNKTAWFRQQAAERIMK